MTNTIPANMRAFFERQGVAVVQEFARGVGRYNQRAVYARIWLEERRSIAAQAERDDQRTIAERSIAAAEDQASSARESARQARSSSVAAWWAAGLAFVTALLAFVSALFERW